MRALTLPSGQEIILLDTVGFISKIPHELIDAFRATLEEVTKADLIVHLRDISHPSSQQQNSDVYKVLQQIGIGDESEVPIVEVRNKIDCLDPKGKEFHANQAARRSDYIVITSATMGEGFNSLLDTLDTILNNHNQVIKINLPWSEGKTLAWIYKRGQVIFRQDKNDSIDLTIKMHPSDAARLESRLSN